MSDYLGRIITKTPTPPSPTSASGVWSLDEALQYQKAGKWPPGYAISRSVRLRSSASAYFNRTLTTPTSSQKYTWSGWIKRGKLDSSGLQGIFCPYSSGTVYGYLAWYQDGIRIFDRLSGGTNFLLQTTAVYRDASAWYHIVYAVDTTQATAANRVRLYVNGVEVTAFSTSTYPTQNNSTTTNSAIAHYIGYDISNTGYFDGYQTEINFIDGQALTPDYFGYADTATGVWQPIPYTGTYGTNGFYLNFSDNSAATAAAIGKDYSGNGNNWTPTNISVTAGATYDSMVDSPSMYGADTGVGGEVRGNYATWNAVAKASSQPTFSNGNLDLAAAAAAWSGAVGTIGVTSGKWYWEVVNGNADTFVGICGDNLVLATADPQTLTGTILYYGADGRKRVDGTLSAYGASYTTETIGVALDIDGGTVTFYKSNSSQGSISLSSSTLNGRTIFPFIAKYASTANINFGQRPFSYTAPSGYKALNTQNLPVPTINNGANYMAATLYTGNGATQSLVNTVNNISFQPDFVWIKDRSAGYQHSLQDVVRGTGASKKLYSSLSEAENGANSVYGYLSSFDTSGFSVSIGASGAQQVNASGTTYVGWQWKGGGTAVSNTSGTITSSVSASTTAGFSVVTYTGSGSSATVGHGLGVAPSMIIIKNRGSAQDWRVYHTSVGVNAYLALNTPAASASDSGWTATSSTTFTVGGSGAQYNASTNTYVAYCFAPIAGYSAFGTYTGNGSTDGPFVYLGFRPRFVMWKNASAVEAWLIEDTARSTYNEVALELYPSSSSAEAAGSSRSPTQQFDYLSNGFKVRGAQTQTNGSGNTIIYAAFAENPFKYARAR